MSNTDNADAQNLYGTLLTVSIPRQIQSMNDRRSGLEAAVAHANSSPGEATEQGPAYQGSEQYF